MLSPPHPHILAKTWVWWWWLGWPLCVLGHTHVWLSLLVVYGVIACLVVVPACTQHTIIITLNHYVTVSIPSNLSLRQATHSFSEIPVIWFRTSLAWKPQLLLLRMAHKDGLERQVLAILLRFKPLSVIYYGFSGYVVSPGRHSGLMGSTVALRQEGPWFEPQGAFLWGVFMFSC